ncbi:hypothetical protein BDP27DRAFT_1430427 [Rhodocollybia butyracea]|uniref:Uncharacterized protein n=1 Tax=Rhodocollybia butyracea TaxID=206335 RepID=A0A9P5PDF1_9AGAR|nr:hypothetical protein BDP27DRAFT_1430427 [Rhodocollybia butyracea]
MGAPWRVREESLSIVEALRKGTGQRSQWQLGLLLTHPPSGPSFILPNPLHKESHQHQSSPIYPPVSLKMSALDTDDSDIVVLDLHKPYMVPWKEGRKEVNYSARSKI